MAADKKQFTAEELSSLTEKNNVHLLIHGKVYAVAKFLDEHPGGDEVLLGEAGRDATEAFEDVGHSDEARELLEKLYVGDGPEGSAAPGYSTKSAGTGAPKQESSTFTYLLPLAFLFAWIAYRYYG